MLLSRRILLASAGFALPIRAAQPLWLFVGAYTSGKNKGISTLRFDPETGVLSDLNLAIETPNPTFLTLHTNRRLLFAVNEVGSFEGRRAGSVTAFALDRATGRLSLINQVSTGGPGPCHVSLDRTGRMVMIANYGGGSVASYKLLPGGNLSEAISFHQHEGTGPVTGRQQGPHAHCIYPSPQNKFAVACDLGTDHVHIYSLDPAAATLTPASRVKVADGAGPRHFAWHPKGRFGYVINELSNTVTACRWDESSGKLEPFATMSTLPPGFTGQNSTAEVVVHPNGKWLYGSNRGKDEIVFAALDAQGKPEFQQSIPVQGQIPRNFVLDPSGRWLLAANQKTDNIIVFRIDQASGRLESTGHGMTIGAPVCLRFLP